MEKINALEVANSPAIWGLAAIAVIAVFVEIILFFRLARKASHMKEVNLTKKQCNRALRAGIVSAIGPAFGVFIVMIGLIAVLGGPISWLRLSVIGGATTELTAATVGVKALGGDITQALSMVQLSNAWWTMTINACGWLVVTWLFASRMEKVRNKIGGGDSRWMEIFSSAATLGIFGAFCSEYAITGIQSADFKVLLVMAVSAIAMWILQTLSNRYKWLKEYSLGLAMVAGIASSMLF